MGGQRRAEGLSAVLLLLTACCALPVPPGEEDDSVSQLSEDSGVSENVWFKALEEERPGREEIIGRQDDGAVLGEDARLGGAPDEESIQPTGGGDEAMAGIPGERGTVPNTGSPPSDPPRQASPDEPEEPGNPFGQLYQDMQDQKKSHEEMEAQKRRYDKIAYHDASREESDALNEAVTVAQGLSIASRPDPLLENAAEAANQQLIEAVDKRSRLEGEHSGTFASKDFKPVPDAVDPKSEGFFAQGYRLNLQMKQPEEAARKLKKAFGTSQMSNKVRRDLYPNKKKRHENRGEEDIFYNYETSKSNYKPENSRAFHDAKKNKEQELKMMKDLQEAAKQYKIDKLSNQDLKYAEFVKGTPLEGIVNVFALTGGDIKKEVDKLNLVSSTMRQGEFDLDNLEEQYIQKYDSESRIVPFDEWAKKWNMERMVNEEVKDPDNPVSEKQIKEDTAKLYQEKMHPSLEKDVEYLTKIREQEQELHDMNVAHIVSLAPKDADFAQMKKEKVVGAEQLEADTIYANRKLVQESAHPDNFGPQKALNPEATPDYDKVDRETELKEADSLEKKNQKAILADAEALAKNGTKADQAILEHDEKMALNGKPASNAEEKKEIAHTTNFVAGLKKKYGNETAEDMKAGIQIQFKKEMKAWDQVKKTVEGGGVSPKYGAEALRSLPTRSSSPELEGDQAAFSFSGNSEDSVVPLRMDEPPNDGSSQLPEDTSEIETSQIKAGAEDRPRTGYPQDDEDTPVSQEMSPEKVADEVVRKDDVSAEKEAAEIEGVQTPVRPGEKGGATDKEMEKQMATAREAETAVEAQGDTEKAAQEMNVNPKDMTKEPADTHVIQSDADGQWKAAAEEINEESAAKEASNPSSQATENSGDQENTEDGTPVR